MASHKLKEWCSLQCKILPDQSPWGTISGLRLCALFMSLVLATVATGCSSNAPEASATSQIQSATTETTPTARVEVEQQPVPGGPVLLRSGINVRKVTNVPGESIKLARNPVDGLVYMLNLKSGLYQVDLTASRLVKRATTNEIVGKAQPAGMAFAPDGTLFIVGNQKVGANETQAVISKGLAGSDGDFKWVNFASTAPYPMSNTYFDHLFNGIVVSTDGKWVIVSSGSRTDHGEVQSNAGAFPETREVALTAKIFRLPADAQDLSLLNDEAALRAQGMIFAEGTRNAYDLEFAPNGDLFAVDNGPDADYPDELNWIRPGQHYGFPWRFGEHDNPQQFADYDSAKDKRLSSDFAAVQAKSYHNDPSFPKPPGAFASPVANLGPAAALYINDDGKEQNAAAEGQPLYSFTPHRSPLGLVFPAHPQMPADLQSSAESVSAFILSWGAAGGGLSDQGRDLLHLQLRKQGDNYESVTTVITRQFKNPIDAVMIENRLYVLEYGDGTAIWELTFE